MSIIFTPVNGGTKKFSVTDSSGSTYQTISSTGKILLLTNLGTNKCFVRVSSGSDAATTSDLPVAAGDKVFMCRNEDHTSVAAICESTETATLYVTPGDGA